MRLLMHYKDVNISVSGKVMCSFFSLSFSVDGDDHYPSVDKYKPNDEIIIIVIAGRQILWFLHC